MNNKHRRRLRKLGNFLWGLKADKWDYGSITDIDMSPHHVDEPYTPLRCGSTACALGWTPAVFPKRVRWGNELGDGYSLYFMDKDGNEVKGDYDDSLAEFFGLDYDTHHTTFYSAYSVMGLDEYTDVTAKHLAQLLFYLADNNGQLPDEGWEPLKKLDAPFEAPEREAFDEVALRDELDPQIGTVWWDTYAALARLAHQHGASMAEIVSAAKGGE